LRILFGTSSIQAHLANSKSVKVLSN